jgi:hypothetical protein
MMRTLLILLLHFLLISGGWAADTVAPTPFSAQPAGAALPTEWREVTVKSIPAHTRYSLVQDGDAVVLRAESKAAMSSLRHAVDVDPARTPLLRWRWKVENLIPGSDMTRKDGDDFPARVYVFFDYKPDRLSLMERMKLKLARGLYGADLPLAVLCYVWDRQAPVNHLAPSPYTDRVRMVVAESGAAHVGQWVEITRNVADDFSRAFGESAPRINGIALATDTDNTGASAVALYGDFRFESAP